MTKLVITRKAGQTVHLQDESGTELAEITILKLERNQVRVLFSATISTKISREETDSNNKSKSFVDV